MINTHIEEFRAYMGFNILLSLVVLTYEKFNLNTKCLACIEKSSNSDVKYFLFGD